MCKVKRMMSVSLSSVCVFVIVFLLGLVATPQAFAADSGGTQAMYRLYNPNSGEHFYTASAGERDAIVQVGWRYEGIGWTAPKKSNTPVYRLYNPNAGDHHYTTSAGERDVLIKVGWRYEGIGWYSSDSKAVALLRQYNPNARAGAHNFTTSAAENKMLVGVGWRAEGIGWYGVSNSTPSSSSTGSGNTQSSSKSDTTSQNTYTIKYNANGGTGKMADQKLTWAPTKLSANTFVRSGYKFVGWKVTIDGFNYSFSDKETVTALTYVGKTLTFYAQWEKLDSAAPSTTTYTVTFKDGLDGKTLKTEKVANGKSATPPSPAAHTGYSFVKWDKSYSKITANTTVTATYTKVAPKTFTVRHVITISNDAFTDNKYAHNSNLYGHYKHETDTVVEGQAATFINDEIIDVYGSKYRLIGTYAISTNTGKEINPASINEDTTLIYVLKNDYWAWRQQWIRDNLSPSMTDLQKVARIVYMIANSYDYAQPGVGFPVWSWINDVHTRGMLMWKSGQGVCQDAWAMMTDFLEDVGIKTEPYYPWSDHIQNRVWIDGEIWTCDATPMTGETSGEMWKSGYLEDYNWDQNREVYLSKFYAGEEFIWMDEGLRELF